MRLEESCFYSTRGISGLDWNCQMMQLWVIFVGAQWIGLTITLLTR